MNKLVHLTKWMLVLGAITCAQFSFGQLLGLGSNWHYLDNGTDQGTAWKEVVFDDSAWPDGNAGLGYPAGAGISTVVNYGMDPDNKYITTYFRKNFTISDISQVQFVKLTLKRDDGAVIYINGTEVVRSNMPAGAFNYQTLAPANENLTLVYAIPASAFVQGNNLVAVEVHQTALTSSDVLFDLSLENVVDQPIIGAGTVWKFRDTGTDLGTSWTANGFDDSAWTNGIAPMGYGMTGVVTTVSFGSNASAKYPTTYFRKNTNIDAALYTAMDSVRLTLTVDDGAVVHLNGTEIFRRNMAAGTQTYSTLANVTVGSTASSFVVTLPKSAFLIGNNTFAVEIHQVTAGSSDIFFNFSAQPLVNDISSIASGSNWSYSDSGTDLGTTWTDPAFDESTWATGNAPLGYGNGDEATIVSFGPNIAQKHITTYFRKHFNVASLAGLSTVRIQVKRDDAAVVYINGIHVYRNNLPMGAVSFATTALSPVEGADENQWITIYVPISAIQAGDNVIAVEVHKFNAIETDLRFDLRMDLQSTTQTTTAAIPFVACDPSTNNEIGCFTSVKPSAQTSGLVIPSTHTFQKIMKQGTTSFYSNSSSAVPANTDFTGYVPTNGSSREGVLSVNHENDPGDVSLISLHFNDETKLWVKDSARKVDFTPLVRTTRNCSGGVTPWGTVVTSEETYTTGDVNGDGYHDRGWQVEIDPISGQIVDQDGNGTPDKLWAMGRMNHENICVSADSTVAYQAEDGGTSGVYKYVMTVKGQLKAGTLYVLKRDNPTATTGTWVVVPNTTIAERNTVSTVITSLGGTNWNGPEDVEFGPDGKMYFTSKGTGTIWRFNDDGTTVSNIEAWVTNANYPITYADGTINESWGTGIDNLTFDNEGNCWAQQDGGRGHLWVVRPEHTPATPKVDLFCVTPSGSEPTGLTFTPDGRYGFVSFQHPSGTAAVADANNENVTFNGATTVVFARKEFLGSMAVEPRFELGNAISACDSVQLTANTNADVVNVWNDNSTSAQLYATQTGWYKATAYSNNGRSFADSIFVTITPTPSAPSIANVVACFGTPVADFSATGTNVQWYNDDQLMNQVQSGNTFNTGLSSVGTTNFYATQSLNGCVSDAQLATVTINALPADPITANAEICSGSAAEALNATGTSVEWFSDVALVNLIGNGNDFQSSETVSGSYTYYATQTDANGCKSNPVTATYVIHDLPLTPVTNNAVICQGTTPVPVIASGTSVQWYSDVNLTQVVGSGSSFVSSETLPGTYNYYATQTDNFGCVSSGAFSQYTINAIPGQPAVQSVALCFGTATPALSATGSTIQWFSDALTTNQVATGNTYQTGLNAVGNYTFYVRQTDGNGCVSPAQSATLTINALPASPATTSNAICFGSATAPISATGSSIQWFNNSSLTNLAGTGNSFFSPQIMPGNYTYFATQTDANGCRSNANTASYIVRALPTSPITNNAALCTGASPIALTASGTNIEWFNDLSLNNPIGSGVTFTSSETLPGTYNYYVTQTDNFGCQSTAHQAQYVIYALPSAPSVQSATACFGTPTPALTASGTAIQWYSDAALTNQVAIGNSYQTGLNAVGYYPFYVRQTDANGCVSAPIQVDLTINSIPSAPVISGDLNFCFNETMTGLNASGSNIVWYGSVGLLDQVGTGNNFTPSNTTIGSSTYYANQTVLGCTSSSTPVTVVVHPIPAVSFSGLETSYGQDDASAQLSGLPSGGIFSGAGIVGNQFDPSFAGVGGPYTITYTYTNSLSGCSNSSTSIVSVTSSVGIVELANGSSFEVYPNPASEEMTVRIYLPQSAVVNAVLYDAQGRSISVQTSELISEGERILKINRSALQLSSGTYFLNVKVDADEKTLKVVFQ